MGLNMSLSTEIWFYKMVHTTVSSAAMFYINEDRREIGFHIKASSQTDRCKQTGPWAKAVILGNPKICETYCIRGGDK
jgi:hypothetical protein